MIDGQSKTFALLGKIGKDDKVIWFHCSSLGEFEQARNLIETIKTEHPNHKILLSFFSPSGYEVRKNYDKADWVVYLPIDTKRNAKKFVELAHPSLVFFVKYEFWYNYIRELKETPLFQVSLILRKNHYLTRFYSAWFVKQLKNFTTFFVQDALTKDILLSLGYKNAILCGDTRFDRVSQISKEEKHFPLIEEFCKGGKKIFIAGSSWEQDEKIIAESLLKRDDIKIILAPHKTQEEHIRKIEKLFPDALRYSLANERNIQNSEVLIIDCIGILSKIYSLSHIVYIGGGFGEGIHNILEAAVFYKPVAFGPNNKKFKEARDLLSQKAATEIHSAHDLFAWADALLRDSGLYERVCRLSGDYVKNNVGATQKILNNIAEYL
ncbi:MAG: 3-deoxy-D-manno-octulosonic acid transferase [Bacteroidales bacterium]|nr:3-deoxy-D-manno-octulosonic acid transferase [Bacteroidales bacterium]